MFHVDFEMVIIAATVHFMRMGMTNVGVASRTQQDDFWSFFVLIEASFAPTQNMTKQQVISLVCSAGGPQANTSYSTQSAIDASPSAVFFTTVQLESTGCSLSTQNQNESHWSESMTINLYMNQHESTWINMNQHARKQWDDEISGLVCGCDQAMLFCLRRSLLPGA